MNVLNILKPYRFRPTVTQQDFDDVERQVRNVPGAAALATTLGLGPLLAYLLTRLPSTRQSSTPLRNHP